MNANRTGLIVLSIASYWFMCGNNPNCDPMDMPPPLNSCTNPSMRIPADTCATVTNPCAADWIQKPDWDYFDICDPTPQGFRFRESRATGDLVRTICVGRNVAPVADVPLSYFYQNDVGASAGTIFVSVAPDLDATVTASPDTIDAGDESHLLAEARGGIENSYLYSWSPSTGLNATNIAAPTASPLRTTTYEVTITDASHQSVRRMITVHVRGSLEVEADPPEINASEISQLTVIASGGTPPYTYAWDPIATLDDPTNSAPIATPSVTTTYHVVVTDNLGVSVEGFVTVRVAMAATANANPDTISSGDTSQLGVIIVGGLPPYTYDWTPPDTLDDASSSSPIASPTVSTLYSVVVSDSEGFSTNADVTVNVANSNPAPTASFTFNVQCCPQLNVDASASSGTIVSYAWDLSWTGPSTDRITTGPTTSFTIRETDHGTITLIVTAADGQTATASMPF